MAKIKVVDRTGLLSETVMEFSGDYEIIVQIGCIEIKNGCGFCVAAIPLTFLVYDTEKTGGGIK